MHLKRGPIAAGTGPKVHVPAGACIIFSRYLPAGTPVTEGATVAQPNASRYCLLLKRFTTSIIRYHVASNKAPNAR